MPGYARWSVGSIKPEETKRGKRKLCRFDWHNTMRVDQVAVLSICYGALDGIRVLWRGLLRE
jgi:hypothetical protein